MNDIKHMCVLIPANNEEKLLPRCLHSILKASTFISPSISVDIVLCVDSSWDNTRCIGEKIIGSRGVVIETNKKNVGIARAYAVNEALSRYDGPLECCWLSNTDADCEVPSHWLNKQLFLASQGFEGIAGIVKVDSYAEHETQVPRLFEDQYIIHENGTHPHIHGANLGLRADAYKNIGGWSPLTTAEDHDLWNRLIAFNYNLISCADVHVTTSGRKEGRAPRGFAGKLASYNRSK